MATPSKNPVVSLTDVFKTWNLANDADLKDAAVQPFKEIAPSRPCALRTDAQQFKRGLWSESLTKTQGRKGATSSPLTGQFRRP